MEVESVPNDEKREKEIKEDLLVVDEDGNKHYYGEHTKRTRLYAKEKEQITKSCHVCQNQHVSWKCKASTLCSFSYCERCLKRYHSDLSIRDAIASCPVCRGICVCRSCLRKMWNPKLELKQNTKDNKKCAAQILNCCGPFVSKILNQFDQEVFTSPESLFQGTCVQAKTVGFDLDEVQVETVKYDFITCDVCSTSIADLHYGCSECRMGVQGGCEVCLNCVSEWRSFGEEYLKSKTKCTSCGSRLRPVRFMSKEMLKTLRAIKEDFGDKEDRPVMPLTIYPDIHNEGSVVEADLKMKEDKVGLEFVVREPPGLKEYLETRNASSEAFMKQLESRLEKFQDKIELRDAGYGQSVRVVDLKDWDETDINDLLSLCIWKGEPLIVRNVNGKIDWRPQTMSRVFADNRGMLRSRRNRKRRKDTDSSDEVDTLPSEANAVCVIDCSENWRMESWSRQLFFKFYEKGGEDDMFKVKDWPPEDKFQDKLQRHYQDFVEMLPFAKYTNPVSGVLNMTVALPEYRCRPDLGPKTYIATGRMEERNDGTDSVTKLHLDMTDAINILLHAQFQPGRTKQKQSGSVWTMVHRKDVAKLTEYLRDPNAICLKKSYLNASDREVLVRDHGVKMWTFEQFENDAIYVPSGCPHQVRNTRSCLKVAIDFFPPESTGVVMELVRYRQQFAKRIGNNQEEDVADSLQSVSTVLYAAVQAHKVLKGKAKGFAVVREGKKRKWAQVEGTALGGDLECSSNDEDSMDTS